MSFAVVERPTVKRTLPRARSGGSPSAVRTCDGSTAPAVHADPEEAQMPCWSRSTKTLSLSTKSNSRFALFGRRRVRCPLTEVWDARQHPLDQAFAQRQAVFDVRGALLFCQP